jgi:hypothetical protein
VSDPTCPNLLELAGGRYKVTFDPAYDPYHVPRDKLDRWMMRWPCAHGEIYPWGDGVLAAFVHAKHQAAGRLLAIPGVVLWTDGDDGKTVTFPVAVLDQVAEVMKPRKRHRCNRTPEQLAELSRRGLEALARKREGLPQGQQNAPVAPPGARSDPEPGAG